MATTTVGWRRICPERPAVALPLSDRLWREAELQDHEERHQREHGERDVRGEELRRREVAGIASHGGPDEAAEDAAGRVSEIARLFQSGGAASAAANGSTVRRHCRCR
jgi:hypothetical protein